MTTFHNKELFKKYPHLLDKKEKRLGGVLGNGWKLITDHNNVVRALGPVYHDTCWKHGQTITTSAVVSLDLKAKKLETLNTIYEVYFEPNSDTEYDEYTASGCVC